MKLYKATRPNGTDFRTGSVLYAVGETIEHPRPHKRDASGYLSVSITPTDCVGASWPLRLFEVEAVEVWTDLGHINKRCTHSLTVVRELDAIDALGPQGQAIVALIERCGALTYEDGQKLWAAWDAARGAARDAAWGAAWGAARDAARDAAWGAASALMVRDLIGDGFTQEQYDVLTEAWRKVVGPLHPDDADLSVRA